MANKTVAYTIVIHPTFADLVRAFLAAKAEGHRTVASDDVLQRTIGFDDKTTSERHHTGLFALRAWHQAKDALELAASLQTTVDDLHLAMANPAGRNAIFGSH